MATKSNRNIPAVSSIGIDIGKDVFHLVGFDPNGEIFYTLEEAKVLIAQWRKHYNTLRPHSALGYRPPAPETTRQHRVALAYAIDRLQPDRRFHIEPKGLN